MMRIILFIALMISTAKLMKYTLEVNNLTQQHHKVLSDYIELDDNNIRDFSFDFSELKVYLKSQKRGDVNTIHFKCDKCEKHNLTAALELKQDPSRIKGIKVVMIASNDQITGFNINLSTEGNDSVQFYEVSNPKVEIKTQEFKIPVKESKINLEQPGAEKPVEEEKPFFKKYFWYIVIGGMVVMNIASFDKKKLNEAYNQAQQQSQAQRR